MQTMINILRGMDTRVRSMEREIRYMQSQQGGAGKLPLAAVEEAAIMQAANQDFLWGLTNGMPQMPNLMPAMPLPGASYPCSRALPTRENSWRVFC